MATYTIHQPPPRRGETAPDPGRFVFVRDGFHFWAFLLAPFWMLRHRLWLVLLLYVAGMALLSLALWYVEANVVAPVVHFLVALLIGIEAATLRRWTLAGRGWKNRGIVVGDDRESAEQRFFDVWVKETRNPASPPMQPETVRRTAANPPQDVIGLFPEPGARR